MRLLLVFLALLYNILLKDGAAHLFPHNGAVYNYMAEVESGLKESAPHISKFKIRASLHVQLDTSDPSHKNAYYFWMTDVKHEMYNGLETNNNATQEQSIPETSLAIQHPFLVIYNDDHSLQGLKFQNSESDWSRNMKKAIAAALQIDYSSINITDDFQRKSFFTNESTVHGICEISYDVRTPNYQPFSESNGVLITKIHEPSGCQLFVQSEFNHVESFGCYIAREEDLVTSARKQVYLEKSDDVLFIKKLKTDESFYYFPWMHRSEMHYIQGSMSLELSKDALNSATPKVDFQSIPITSSIAIEERNVTEDNSTQSKHAVDQSGLIQKVLKLVFEIADYLEENHLDVNHTNFEHSQLLNKLLTNMYGLQLDSIEKVYEALLVSANREDSARKIFLEMVPHVGTTASCLFIRNALTQANYTITYVEAIDMLVKLPSYVRQPTQELLLEMEILLLEDDYFPENLIDNYVEIRKAAILSFASLLYKTFKNSHDENIPVIENYLQYINEYLLDSTNNNYEMKLVYIMALRNIQIGGIERFLIPIINGEVVIHERQEYSQLAASFAVAQAINHDKELVHTVFWPILSNTTNSRQFRIVAYDILMSQMSDVTRAMNIHRLMTREQDMHLYNYHYTTIKSLAHLADSCLRPVTELARKIWRLTKHRDVQGSLSGSYVIDYADSKYGYGETFKLALNVDDETLWPNMGIFEYYHSIGRRSSPDWGVYWNTNMFSNMINGIKHFISKKKEAISNKSITEFLDKIKSDDQLSQKQNGHFELCQIYRGKIVKVHAIAIAEFKYETMFDAIDYILQKYIKVAANINLQSIWFKTLYEMNLLSETGFPIIFSNRLPILQSSRIKVEFSVDQGNFNLKLKANNQFQGHGSYEMVVYNPIANVSHSVQRISAVDAAYPLEFEIFYSPEEQSFNMTFPKSMNFKNKGIRIHVSKYVSILGDENNSLKSHCPLCKNYEMVNQDLKNVINYQKSISLKDIGLTYSQTIFSCEKNMAPILNINIFLEILKAQDPDFGYEPIYKVFTALSHKAFNEVISPDIGTCGNLILLTDEFDDSQIELNINWGQITENLKKFYLRGSMNSVSFSNHSSFNFWNVNIDYYFDLAIDFTFTRQAIGQKNLVVCFKSKKLDSLDKYAFEIALTESQQCNTGEVIFNANIEGQCAFNYPLGIQYLKNSTFAKECTLNDEGLQSGKTYYIDISYSEVLEEISSVIYSLSETIRIFYLANTRYLDYRYMKQRNMKITILFNLPETNGMNLFISTPFVTYEMQDLPIKYNSYIVPLGICKIFSKSALLRNNKTSSLKLLDWTLIASDYFDSNYAVFAKVIQNNSMAIQIYHGTHVLEIEPIAMGRVFKVTIDGVTQIDFNPRPGRFHDFVISFIEEEHYIDVELIGTPINIYFKRHVLAITASHSLKRSLGLCAEV